MSDNSTAETTPAKLSVADFIDGQLGMFQRRATPEERAQIRWWRARIAILAKQEPSAAPAEPSAQAEQARAA